jgi:hypothetical protein
MTTKTVAAQKLERLLPELDQLHTKLTTLSSEFGQFLSDFVVGKEEAALKHDVTYWTFVAHSDAVKRLALIIEQNFSDYRDAWASLGISLCF